MPSQSPNISIIDFLHHLPASRREALLRTWQQDPELYGAAEEGFAAKMAAIKSGDKSALADILTKERVAAEEFIRRVQMETARLQLEQA